MPTPRQIALGKAAAAAAKAKKKEAREAYAELISAPAAVTQGRLVVRTHRRSPERRGQNDAHGWQVAFHVHLDRPAPSPRHVTTGEQVGLRGA
jgi:hypothetical protein